MSQHHVASPALWKGVWYIGDQAGDTPCHKGTERSKGQVLGEQTWVHS